MSVYDGPKTSPFKVWHVPQVPMKAFVVECVALDEAAKIVDVLARYDLFQYENKVKPDYANASGVVEWDQESDGYCEVEDDDPRLLALVEAS